MPKALIISMLLDILISSRERSSSRCVIAEIPSHSFQTLFAFLQNILTQLPYKLLYPIRSSSLYSQFHKLLSSEVFWKGHFICSLIVTSSVGELRTKPQLGEQTRKMMLVLGIQLGKETNKDAVLFSSLYFFFHVTLSSVLSFLHFASSEPFLRILYFFSPSVFTLNLS